MQDLRLELRCRNNVLWHGIFDLYPSVSEFCRHYNLGGQIVGGYLNLTRNPYNMRHCSDLLTAQDPVLSVTAESLCQILGLGANELFPILLYSGLIPARRVAEISAAQLPVAIEAAKHLSLPPTQDDLITQHERHKVLELVLQTLNPREERIIRRRFGLDGEGEHTLEEIGQEFGVTGERIK